MADIERDEIRKLVREVMQQQLGGPVPASDSADLVDESVREVITEGEVRHLPEGAKLLIREDAVLTPSAKDLIAARGIELRYRSPRGTRRLIAIGSDHGGFEMKQQLARFLAELGYRYRDFGTFSSDPVDYPDYAHAVARAVADGGCDLGILLDGAGIGSCMTANKVPGVRAAMCYDEATAQNSREHNYANVLSLGARMISPEAMTRIVKTWLSTPEGEARHGKRVAKIMAVEKQYLR